MAVGYAMTMWENLEEELCQLFAAYLGTISPAVKRAYGSIVSATGRVGMLKEVIEATFGLMQPETASLHTKAMDQIGSLAGRRNEIAHGIVKCESVNGEMFGNCLFPPSYNSNKNYSTGEYFSRVRKPSKHNQWITFFTSRGKYAYTPVEIIRYAEMFKVSQLDIQAAHLYLFEQRIKHLAQSGDKTSLCLAGDNPSTPTAPPRPSPE